MSSEEEVVTACQNITMEKHIITKNVLLKTQTLITYCAKFQ